MEADPQHRRWQEHDWSAWYPIDAAIVARKAHAPAVPGIYRVRCRGQPGLIYIGETGRSIRTRLRQLRVATRYAKAGQSRFPHVAGPCVLAHEEKGLIVEVSWMEMAGVDKRERRGIECELIAAYRKTFRGNPVCQFAGEISND